MSDIAKSVPFTTAGFGDSLSAMSPPARLPIRTFNSFPAHHPATPLQETLDLSKAFLMEATVELKQALSTFVAETEANDYFTGWRQFYQDSPDAEHENLADQYEGEELLQRRLDATEVGLQMSQSLNHTLLHQTESSKVALAHKDAIIKGLNTELKNASDEVARLAHFEHCFTNLMKELNKAQDAPQESLNLQGYLSQELNDVSRALKEAETERDSLKAQLLLAKAAQKEVWENVRRKMAETNDFVDERKCTVIAHAGCQKRTAQKEKEIANKDQAIKDREDELQEMHAELQKANRENSQKEIDLKDASQELAKKEIEVADSLKIRKMLAQELTNVRKAYEREQDERKQLAQKLVRQEEDIEYLDSRIDRRDERIHEIEDELKLAETVVNRAFAEFKTELATRDTELEEIKASKARLVDHVNFLEQLHMHANSAPVAVPTVPDRRPVVWSSIDAVHVPAAQGALMETLCRDIEARNANRELQEAKKWNLFSGFVGMFRRRKAITSQPWN